MKLEVVRALNPEPDKRICRTIKAQYQKNGIANFVRGGSFGATAVIRKTRNTAC